jgi:hypothetical protein
MAKARRQPTWAKTTKKKNHVSRRRTHAQALGPENNGLHVHLALLGPLVACLGGHPIHPVQAVTLVSGALRRCPGQAASPRRAVDRGGHFLGDPFESIHDPSIHPSMRVIWAGAFFLFLCGCVFFWLTCMLQSSSKPGSAGCRAPPFPSGFGFDFHLLCLLGSPGLPLLACQIAWGKKGDRDRRLAGAS